MHCEVFGLLSKLIPGSFYYSPCSLRATGSTPGVSPRCNSSWIWVPHIPYQSLMTIIVHSSIYERGLSIISCTGSLKFWVPSVSHNCWILRGWGGVPVPFQVGPCYSPSYSSSTLGHTSIKGLSLILSWILYWFPKHRGYTREIASPSAVKFDIYDTAYVGRIFLYVFCGLLDSMWQTTVYWLMGSMSNDPATLAHFVGFCKHHSLLYEQLPQSLETDKSIQSAGAAGVWRADGVGLPWVISLIMRLPSSSCLPALIRYMNIFVSTWVLLVVGLILAFPVIHMFVKDHDQVSGVESWVIPHFRVKSSHRPSGWESVRFLLRHRNPYDLTFFYGASCVIGDSFYDNQCGSMIALKFRLTYGCREISWHRNHYGISSKMVPKVAELILTLFPCRWALPDTCCLCMSRLLKYLYQGWLGQ